MREPESRERYDRRMEREFFGRFMLVFALPALLILLAAFVGTRH